MVKNNNAGAQAPSDNEKATLQASLTTVLKALWSRREEVAAVLPPDVDFDNFYATVNQALRNNPDVLKATPVSIVNACVKAAYDGLRPDGREAAIVTHNVNVGTRANPKWECQAQYFPMAQGLIQQILRGGEVLSIEAEVIFQHDHYRIIRGTHRSIEHVPMVCREDGSPLEPGDRGAMILAYTVVQLKSGVILTEYLTADQILDIQKASKSGWSDEHGSKGVWKRWPRQMWLKTIIRFHRKTLPLGERRHPLRDTEQDEQFPDMAQKHNPLGLSAPPPPRPARQPEQISDQSGTQNGVDLGFGNTEFVDGDGVIHEKEPAKAKPAAKPKEQKAPAQSNAQIPETDTEWMSWSQDVEADLMGATTAEQVNKIATEERERLEAATPDRRNWINGVISERLAELASATDGAAPAEGQDPKGQE